MLQQGLPGTNTLAYWTYSLIAKKIKFCEYSTWDHIRITLFSLYFTNLVIFVSLCPLMSYKENKVL